MQRIFNHFPFVKQKDAMQCGIYVSPEDMLRKDVPLPAILHWKQNHFVVLYRVKRKKFYLADPGKGRMQMDEAEFGNTFF